MVKNFKEEIYSAKRVTDKSTKDKLAFFEMKIADSANENIKTKEIIQRIYDNRRLDLEELNERVKENINLLVEEVQADMKALSNDLEKLGGELDCLNEKKVNIRELEEFQKRVREELNTKTEVRDLEALTNGFKADLDNRTKIMSDNSTDFVRNLEEKIKEGLEKKVDSFTFEKAIMKKADKEKFENIAESKASVVELEKLKVELAESSKRMMEKMEGKVVEKQFETVKEGIEKLSSEVVMKANKREVLNLLKTKPDAKEVAREVSLVKEALESRIAIDDFNEAMNRQSLINEILCQENCVGRWTWKSGRVVNGYAIPWENQSVNTSPDNFLWEKEKTSICVTTPGLYELTLGFYCVKKPTVQVLVNGEPILAAVNSASYVIHQTSGGKMKNTGLHQAGNVTGLTLIDFVCLPSKARISVSYNGDETGEGFMGIKKL